MVPGEVRQITGEALRGPLYEVVQLQLSDADLRQRRIVLHERAFWDGLGEYSGCSIELRTGEQFHLRRLDHGDGSLDVLGLFAHESQEQVERLLTALDVGRDRVRWEIGADEWRSLHDLHRQWRREHP